MAEEPGVDRWARWLLGGRDAGFTDRERAGQSAFLERVRDRVLDGARIRAGDRVLDIGAGTGLLALEATRRLGATGEVAAIDVSLDSLARCRAAGLRCAAGDAVDMPLAGGSVDVVVARSVLIYVADKRAAVAEIARVLRPGGRVSLFEPVNAAGRLLGFADDDDVPDPLRPQHGRVTETYRAMSPHWEPMMGFDERGLVRAFTQAGFDAVGLDYEVLVTRHAVGREEAERAFDRRGNPTAPTWREAAEAALGADADRYLAGLADAHAARRGTAVSANAFLTAQR